MQPDFTLAKAPISTYKLVIRDRYKPIVLLHVHLHFHTDCTSYKNDGVNQFQNHLSDMLGELPKEKWDRENVLRLVLELISETPFSSSIQIISVEKDEQQEDH